ncbi:aquaporin Z [Fibrobacterales bacterium]|nr:aquaporin Z [Fibrobacterales bacterium]
MSKKLFSEFIGTFVLVLFGCGSAVLAGDHIGFAGVSLAFGLSVLVMAYAVGPISGGHFNPAVTLGLVAGGKFSGKDAIPYIVSQLLGATVSAGVIYLIATGKSGSTGVGDFAANTFSTYGLCAAFLTEAVLTFVFLIVILGSTAKNAAAGFAPIAIGLTLTAIHLVSIPVTNTSVNPARSFSQAVFSANPLALSQLWLFWLAPILGAVIAGFAWRFLFEEKSSGK